MIANDDNSARIYKITEEEEALLERSSAPTLRDLRAAPKEQFSAIAVEPDLTSSSISGPSSLYDDQDNDK